MLNFIVSVCKMFIKLFCILEVYYDLIFIASLKSGYLSWIQYGAERTYSFRGERWKQRSRTHYMCGEKEASAKVRRSLDRVLNVKSARFGQQLFRRWSPRTIHGLTRGEGGVWPRYLSHQHRSPPRPHSRSEHHYLLFQLYLYIYGR